ncbi:hypothetical protein LPB137_04645 [Poseidonibacter parvus]|uniref:Zinc ABC transporter substrate-binding protein n=1 Tax=Poseidonibacter parvus TaxID=1850254 RepID=A0A1P8KKW2_9BACT|nr:zinc ABC transporter substrate-binding protein [Poseidonibacter parvus]APW65181.1 hypothetical protein LPB137_04645 [Poseidonibacter parvus]
MYKLLLLLLPTLLFSKFQVTTSLPFEAHIIKQIGQNHIRIKTISNNFSNKILDLSPTEISSLAGTRVYFNFGLDIEKEYEKIFLKSRKELNAVNMSKDIKKLKYEGEDNPFVWLDPILLREVAKNIYETLSKIDPYNKNDYEANYYNFLNKLDASFLEIKKKLADSEIYNIFVFDEKFDYFAKRFKINKYIRKKRILSASEIKPLVRFVKKNQIKVVFIEENKNINFAKSLSGHSNILIKTFNPYEELLFYNLSKIAQEFIE